MANRSLTQKILYFPLTKIILGLIVCLASAGLWTMLTQKIFEFTSLPQELERFITAATASVLVLFVYFFFFKYYEKRQVSELSKEGMGKSLLWGLFLGFLLQSLTILVIKILGEFSILSVNSISLLLIPLTMAISSAIIEEIIFRGIIFRIIEEKLGSYIALLISALIFGALHIGNPNSSIMDGIGLAIQAGVLLGVAYMFSRNLWLPIAIHFAWNFTQSGIYGANTSGHEMSQSLLTTEMSGADWLTGGSFGPEGSIQATVFCVLLAIALFLKAKQKGQIINPYWKKA